MADFRRGSNLNNTIRIGPDDVQRVLFSRVQELESYLKDMLGFRALRYLSGSIEPDQKKTNI
jgi:hypothetical protein